MQIVIAVVSIQTIDIHGPDMDQNFSLCTSLSAFSYILREGSGNSFSLLFVHLLV